MTARQIIVSKKLINLVDKLSKCLIKKETTYIKDTVWKTIYFYVLSKIHKSIAIQGVVEESNKDYIKCLCPDDLKGRPIAGGSFSPTQYHFVLIEKILSPLQLKLKTYVKVCKIGFAFNDTSNLCEDINECALSSTNNCTANASCNNFVGGYNCTCKSGFNTSNGDIELLSNLCLDINECEFSSKNNCSANAICNNLVGGYMCTCKSGFNTSGGGIEYLSNQCLDINECALSNKNNCSVNATCNNLVGGYNCACKSGFNTSTGGIESLLNQCLDINECALSNKNNCSVNATCNNFVGGYNCTCKSGFNTSNGGIELLLSQCLDINECEFSSKNNCSANAICNNLVSGYMCTCKSGFNTSGGGIEYLSNQCLVCVYRHLFMFIDINECALSNKNNCSVNATCNNLVGGYNCACKSGFNTSTGGIESLLNQCLGKNTNINECALSNKNNCSVNATCNNFVGGYNCTCKSGFNTSNGGIELLLSQCLDINECEFSSKNNCSANAICNNLVGGYMCTCKSGFNTSGGGIEYLSNQCLVCVYRHLFMFIDINECALSNKNNCSVNATCNNLVGGYNCACKSGFNTSTGGIESLLNQCLGKNTNINECALSNKNNCSVNATCNNFVGGYNCTCKSGFNTSNGGIELLLSQCLDINECEFSSINNCSANAICNNLVGGYMCTCKSGFNTSGGGIEYLSNQCLVCVYRHLFMFIDINECALSNKNNCSVNATCNNLVGGYNCACKSGFNTSTGGIESLLNQCLGKNTNINECALSNKNNCSVNATCNNFVGGYNCTCKSGFNTSNGGIELLLSQCLDINECEFSSKNNCSANAICNNLVSGYMCTCKSGFNTSGGGIEYLSNQCLVCVYRHLFMFIDINECALSNKNNCSVNATCNNLVGGYNCACKSGFNTSTGGIESLLNQCLDINECALSNKNNCSVNATCNNFVGGYNCTCKSGFNTSNGGIELLLSQCLDINECEFSSKNNCSANAICNNLVGGYMCTCKSGFNTSGGGIEYLSNQCLDINECALSNKNNCSVNATCNNLVGGYNCACKSGFNTSTGGIESLLNQCLDINECALSNKNNCSVNATCNNFVGGYNCTCKSGFNTSNGGIELLLSQCLDINECEFSSKNNCSANAICNNLVGGYMCTCKSGFNTSGGGIEYLSNQCLVCVYRHLFMFIDINECALSNKNNCSVNATCNNLVGGYNCACKSGFNTSTGGIESLLNQCLGKNTSDKLSVIFDC
ncbi:fibrillin-1-like [Hydra vulgaris]|uniref:Fibrillin-1-like n=1 Tax=Hydra vulgaris TaxID=6087 RepID=A0ABM4B1S5_HYDVU